MQVEQHFVVAHPRAVVWEYFGRLDEVTRCMPGATLAEPAAGNRVKFELSVTLGPIRAAFAGEADVERQAEAFRGTIRGRGHDHRSSSRAKGEVVYRLSEEAGGSATRVDIRVDFALAGRLAQFSRGGLVNDLAARLTAAFASNLEEALNAGVPAEAAPARPSGRPAAPVTRPGAGELRAGRLLGAAVWGRIKALLAALRGWRS